MVFKITRNGSTVLTPTLVLAESYVFTRKSTNIAHDIIGTTTPQVSLRAPGSLTGTLRFLCVDRSEANTIETFHAANGTYHLVDTDNSIIMDYVLADGGSIVSELDPATGTRWLVSVDFLEA